MWVRMDIGDGGRGPTCPLGNKHHMAERGSWNVPKRGILPLLRAREHAVVVLCRVAIRRRSALVTEKATKNAKTGVMENSAFFMQSAPRNLLVFWKLLLPRKMSWMPSWNLQSEMNFEICFSTSIFSYFCNTTALEMCNLLDFWNLLPHFRMTSLSKQNRPWNLQSACALKSAIQISEFKIRFLTFCHVCWAVDCCPRLLVPTLIIF